MISDTICSIATAMNYGGVGIIRVSGRDAIEVVQKMYRTKSGKQILNTFDTHTIHYGYIYDGDQLLDEVMVVIMKAPRSYTMENTVEIDCHGGNLIMKKILYTCIKNGARLAEPGEFTKRAFLNGRIDLTEAEAVMDLIDSKNDFAYKASLKQLKGTLSEKVKHLREDILYEIAFIESALDDPEHISLEGYPNRLGKKVDEIEHALKGYIASAENGKMLKEGIKTVIIGKPNAGKSSFLNVLIGEEKAIVTEVAGTTRDVLEEFIMLKGIGIQLVDTAGIHDTDDLVESIGIEKAKQNAQEADFILFVVDTSVPLEEADYQIMDLLKDKPTLMVCNKQDLTQVISMEEVINECKNHGMTQVDAIPISAKEKIGLEELENKIEDLFFHNQISMNDEIVITNLRHKEALQEAYESIQLVKQSIEQDMPEDFYSIDLLSAYKALGRILGEEIDDDVVNEIFSKFCMGK